MSYLPDNCIWVDLDKEQTDNVIEDFDLYSMTDEGARVNFYKNNCKIQICDNLKINDKPIYLLTCPPDYNNSNKINRLLVKSDQRKKLNESNPWGSTYNKSSISPTTISTVMSPGPVSFKAGKRKKRKMTKKLNKKFKLTKKRKTNKRK